MRIRLVLVLAIVLGSGGIRCGSGSAKSAPVPPARPDSSLADLPLVEVPARGDAMGASLVVWLTGDGGWAETEKGACAEIASRGLPVVGFNMLHYFWKRHEPDEAAADLARVLRHYLQSWKKQRVVLVGYSFGGSVAPFLVNRLPEDLERSVAALILLGPSSHVDFKFHLTSWLGDFKHQGDLPVLPELERMRGKRVICFYGEKDKNCICPTLPARLAEVVELRGGHRVGSHYAAIADSIVALSR